MSLNGIKLDVVKLTSEWKNKNLREGAGSVCPWRSRTVEREREVAFSISPVHKEGSLHKEKAQIDACAFTLYVHPSILLLSWDDILTLLKTINFYVEIHFFYEFFLKISVLIVFFLSKNLAQLPHFHRPNNCILVLLLIIIIITKVKILA